MSSNFNNSGQRRIPTFKISQNLPKHDIKKGQEFLDLVNEAFKSLNETPTSTQQTPTTQPTVRIQQTVVPQPAATASVPRVPSNNRYAGHDQVIARIAKDLVDKAMANIQPHRWSPVSKKTLGAYCKFEVKVYPDRIYLFGMGYNTCETRFVDYDMRSIPDESAFLYAIEPAMKQYLNEAAMAKFAYIHPLSKYSVTGGTYIYNDRVYMEFKIEQHLYPDNSLRSW